MSTFEYCEMLGEEIAGAPAEAAMKLDADCAEAEEVIAAAMAEETDGCAEEAAKVAVGAPEAVDCPEAMLAAAAIVAAAVVKRITNDLL